MKEQIKWETKTGKKVVVTVELTLSETVNLDGQKIEVERCEKSIKAEVEGMGVVAFSEPRKAASLPAGVVAVMGGKLGLSQENYDLVMAAIARLEATPEWQAKIEAQKENDKNNEEYEAHNAKMRQMMSE